MDILLFLEQLTILPFGQLILIGIGVNLILCLASILFYVIVHKMATQQRLFGPYQKLRVGDVLQVGITIVCNAFVLIVGIYLWKYHFLQVDFKADWFTILWQVVVLVIAMDLLMYVFHRLAHWSVIYQFIHQKHHDHVSVNALSLFVLSPFEAIGFGMFLIGVLGCFSFSYEAIIIYLVINLLWGTIGHFNIEFFPSLRYSKIGQWIGTAQFHHTHHQNPQVNYGFYTTFWDKIAGTLKHKRGY